MFFLFNKELIFLIVYLDKVHEYFFRFSLGFSQISCSESNPPKAIILIYLDLLRKEIYSKSYSLPLLSESRRTDARSKSRTKLV